MNSYWYYPTIIELLDTSDIKVNILLSQAITACFTMLLRHFLAISYVSRATLTNKKRKQNALGQYPIYDINAETVLFYKNRMADLWPYL